MITVIIGLRWPPSSGENLAACSSRPFQSFFVLREFCADLEVAQSVTLKKWVWLIYSVQTQQLQSKPIESGCSNLKSRKHNTARRVSSCHRFNFDTLQYILNYGVQADFP